MVTRFDELIPLLAQAQVEFIIIGGVAARVHGSARLTEDLDIAYRRTHENIQRIVQALAPYDPYVRGAPRGLPFQWDERTIHNGLNFTLTTTLGSIDLLGEVTGGGTYDDLLRHPVIREFYGQRCFWLEGETTAKIK